MALRHSESVGYLSLETYPSNHLKVFMAAEIDKFPVEEPLEDEVHVGVSGHPAWQNNALTHRGIHTQWRNCYFGWFCLKKKKKVF